MIRKTLALLSTGLFVALLWIWAFPKRNEPRQFQPTSSISARPDVATEKARRDTGRLASQPSQPDPSDELINALGSPRSDLHAMYRSGISSNASEHQKYVAYQIANMCISAMRRFQHPELPSASSEKLAEINAARAAIAQRCAPLETEGMDHLINDMAALATQVESEGSRHSRSYANYAEARSDAERKAATGRLQELFSEYGPIALQWESGDFSDYIRDSNSDFANDLRLKSGSERISNYAVILTICAAGDLCGSDGLFYLWLCSDHGNCGGSVQAALLDGLSPDEVNVAKSVAQRILHGINTGRWKQ